MKHSLDVNALADFNLVVRHGGFGAAARASGRPKATLSRHIRALEDSLGLRLIDRDSHAFRLTDEGVPWQRSMWFFIARSPTIDG